MREDGDGASCETRAVARSRSPTRLPRRRSRGVSRTTSARRLAVRPRPRCRGAPYNRVQLAILAYDAGLLDDAR
ncbi:hypothetical protein RSA3_04445 [Microbacterium testaceum]|uniref:Uncharacterized protein n=1 Tax=Microbacterium testaceum TaxID=2033 RepID=A0A147FAD9_MICTE|nr:hypothetical protein RSA3_04445 [Microbacterium testaceum]